MPPKTTKASAKRTTNRPHFVAPKEKAKSAVIAQLVRLARKERLDYQEFLYICQQARKKLGLRKPRRERKLPQLLPATELKKFFRVLQKCGDVQHEIMLKLLFFTAVRVSELVRIKVVEIDFDQCKIFIAEGKGSKDRYILFPRSFRLVLQSHLRANPKNRYLFETTRVPLYHPSHSTDCPAVSRRRRNYTAGASAFVPASNAHLFNDQRLVGQANSIDFWACTWIHCNSDTSCCHRALSHSSRDPENRNSNSSIVVFH